MLTIAVVLMLDIITGHEVRLGALYACPVAFGAWYFGRNWGCIAAIGGAFLSHWVESATGRTYSSEWIAVVNTALRFAILVFVYLSVSYFRRTIDIARQEMKAFSGSVPICCRCHRVDGGDGYWTDFPTFIRRKTKAKVEFSVCPNCKESQK